MRKETGRATAIFCWGLALLLCMAALLGRCCFPQRLEPLQQAVFGIAPERVEAAVSILREEGVTEVFSSLEN